MIAFLCIFSVTCGSRVRLLRSFEHECLFSSAKKRLKDRNEETQNLLKQDTRPEEIEDRANQLLLKLERNFSKWNKELLLKQLEEASKEDKVNVSDSKIK